MSNDQTPPRSFKELFQIIAALRGPLAAAAKGKTAEDYLAAAGGFLDVLIQHQVSLSELKDILGELAPLIEELLASGGPVAAPGK